MTISIKSPTSTTGSIQLNGSDVLTIDSSGNLTAPNNLTVTGNVAGSGSNLTNVPATSTALAFHVTNSSDQSVSSSTATKVVLDTEEFDTGGCFDTSNSRFTPTIAGYYLVTGGIRFEAAGGSTNRVLYFYKNTDQYIPVVSRYSGGTSESETASRLFYMNGTTDYLEMYGYISGTSTMFGYSNVRNCCWFQGHLVQKA